MFEIQELLAEAKAGGLDHGARAALSACRQQLRRRQREGEAQLTGALSAAWDAAADAAGRRSALAAFKAGLGTRAYLRTVLDDLDEALDREPSGLGAARGAGEV
jgi:hypothetical protein